MTARAWIFIGLAAAGLTACQQAAPPVPAPVPAAKSERVKPTVAVARADTSETVSAAAAPGCLPGDEQRGPGCDMDGIIAAIRPLRQPGDRIPACYINNVRPPRQGKMLVRFSLTPDGRATGWQWTKDEFALPALQACLQEALASVTYPAPGDKPCQVVYPFTFIPEVRRGE